MSATFSERFKNIDQSTKDTVFGFIKEAQCLLPNHSIYYNIPSGLGVLCLFYYSPPLFCGVYIIEGKDTSISDKKFEAKYNLEFCNDGTIFGTRGKQLICGNWNYETNTINFVLTWQGNCYQYNGVYDTVIREINGKWYHRDENKKDLDGQNGTFKYKFKYKTSSKEIKYDPNNINKNKLQSEYQILLQKYERIRKKTSEIINLQYTEIFALKILITAQRNEIEDYKQDIINITKERDDNINISQKLKQTQLQNDEKEIINDIDDYTKWNWNDIVEWIVNIDNKKYIKYKDILKDKLKEEDVKGNQLCFVDKNDLHRFGIINFLDKVEIMIHIQSLTRQSK